MQLVVRARQVFRGGVSDEMPESISGFSVPQMRVQAHEREGTPVASTFIWRLASRHGHGSAARSRDGAGFLRLLQFLRQAREADDGRADLRRENVCREDARTQIRIEVMPRDVV